MAGAALQAEVRHVYRQLLRFAARTTYSDPEFVTARIRQV